MKKTIHLLLLLIPALCKAQIDTTLLQVQAVHLFPSFPLKSSYTSLLDKRPGLDYLYAANMESGLGIYDISSPDAIVPIMNIPISHFKNLDVSSLTQRGNSLFVGIGDFQVNTNTASGLAILDISNPAAPIVKTIWDSTYFKHGISHLIVKGDYAYLSTMKDGIIILDISDEDAIAFKAHLPLDLNYPAASNNAHNARGLQLKNNLLYVCFDRGGLRMIDVSDKNNPTEVYKYINTSLNSQAAAAYNDVALKDNFAFVSVDYCGIEVIDISTVPFSNVQWYNPWGCNFSNWSGAPLHTNELVLASHDSLLFVTAGQSELLVFDVSDPLNMTKIGEYANLSDTLATHGLDVYGQRIALSFIHTPVHIPPFTPFFADPGGLKLLRYEVQHASGTIEVPAKESSVKFYPNPNTGNTLTIMSERKIHTIQVFNALGQPIFMNDAINNSFFMLNLSRLENGVYTIAVTTSAAQVRKQVIVAN